jgi:endonuclease/exonuclease/phosphatase family metal-dependent hydrolase
VDGVRHGPGSQTPAAQPRDPLTVMTFNIRYGTANDGENRWANRREFLYDVIRTENPDLLGLQEALDGQIQEIISRHPVLRGRRRWPR